MNVLGKILPWWAPYAAGAAVVALLVAGWQWRESVVYQRGWDAHVASVAKSSLAAIDTRLKDNEAAKEKQKETNDKLTEVKSEETTTINKRIDAAPRLRNPKRLCNPAPGPAQAASAASSNAGDSVIGLVHEDVDRDIKSLMKEVEVHLATGRACQAFLRENELVP